jgi:hypothetical protein
MKKILVFLTLMLYTGCSVNEEKDNRICIDYGTFTWVKEKCTPLYGQLICMDQEVTETYCKLYDEVSDEVLLNKP